ncbi:MAG: TIGR04282 family arsenosugar biosynthesis glycosyltransferase [Rhodobacteraceae bacterium]|nr:TIGR04282 family arsenosugar biosynthesis glycosyltransferase [Paracoccaceae bacterium]
MLKQPRVGRVKTRLGHDIGKVRATWWFRHQSLHLIRRMNSDRRWHLVLAVSPDREGMNSRIWPPGIMRLPQGRGDLGARMLSVFRRSGPGPMVIIGSDIPDIRRWHIADAFKTLKFSDAVFGPAMDGGFWLVGLRHSRPPIGMFNGVDWSTPDALAQSMTSLGNRRIGMVETLHDIDNGADLDRLQKSPGA